MRIGIDIRHLTDPQPAGVGGYTKSLLEALFRLDQTNEYFLFATGTPRSLRQLPAFNYPNVRIVSVPIPNKIVNASIALTGRPYLENVFARKAKQTRNREIASSAGNLLAKTNKLDAWFFPNHNFIATRLPYAIMVHDLSYEVFPELFTLKSRVRHGLSRRVIKNADAILCPSTSTKQDLMGIYKIAETKVHVTPLAASTTGAETSPSPNFPKRFVLSLATLEPRKNQISIIEAYEAYRDGTKDAIHLVIGGGAGWKSRPILKAAKQSKYAKEIHLIGYVSEEQKAGLYRTAQVFVFPSFYEGFGLPVLEAMAAGCPVITSHTSSLPELVQDAALLIDPYNVNDSAQAIRQVLSSHTLRQNMIKRGKERAKEFSWEKTARKTQEILSKII